ncbi:hypothetical protein EUX98_g6949 [Antrodiella citrinella]|uniref:Uncharacterized protein n=1 Tax=Antrodiella citrinella TaxID=2447956 RepID=A0A4S4MN13_9APHY|nr:hypothetical protein EUX98_g6949 [Antrodiella citrinella]
MTSQTSQNKTLPADDDFFPDWGTEIPHSTSLSERINLPSSIVEGSNIFISPISSNHLSSYLTNRSPCLLFFYGTLSLPHVLQRVLGLNEAPILLPASIKGFSIKMWGPYPALIRPGHAYKKQPPQRPPTPTTVISSVAAKVKNRLNRGSSSSSSSLHTTAGNTDEGEVITTTAGSCDPVVGMAYWGTEEDIPKLLRYEGENYEMVECVIKAGRDETVGRTFVWCGYAEELTEGGFDPTMFPDVDGRTLQRQQW